MANSAPSAERLAQTLGHVLLEGGNWFAVGNGGSLALCEHFAADVEHTAFAGRVTTPANAALSALANDYGWEHGLATWLEPRVSLVDGLLVVTTGTSPRGSENLGRAVDVARNAGARVAGLLPQSHVLEASCDFACVIRGVQVAHALEATYSAVLHGVAYAWLELEVRG